MFPNQGPSFPIERPRPGALVTLIKGITSVAVTGIVCASGLAGYGMWSFNKHAVRAGSIIEAAMQGMPELMASLPPAVSDMLQDERRPDYASKIRLTSRLVPDGQNPKAFRPVIEVRNTGDQVVTMLSLHVALMQDDAPIWEKSEYAAFPVAGCCDELRGPLMPGAVRHIRADFLSRTADRKINCDISELRVWKPRDGQPMPTPRPSHNDEDEDGDSDA